MAESRVRGMNWFVALLAVGVLLGTTCGAWAAPAVSFAKAEKVFSYKGGNAVLSFKIAGGERGQVFPVPVVVSEDAASWIAVAEGYANKSYTLSSKGTGSGKVKLQVAAYERSLPSPRVGTLAVGGVTFTVRQTGKACVISVKPVSAAMAPEGGSESFQVFATAGCPWAASVESGAWLALGATVSGDADATVAYSAGRNTTGTPRMAKIRVATDATRGVKAQSRSMVVHQAVPSTDPFTAEEVVGSWDSVHKLSDKKTTETTTLTLAADGTGTIFFWPDDNNDFLFDAPNSIAWSIDSAGRLVFVESAGEGPNQWTWTYTRDPAGKVSCTVYVHAQNTDSDAGATYRFPTDTFVKGPTDGTPRFTAAEMPGTWDASISFSVGSKVTVVSATLVLLPDGEGTIYYPHQGETKPLVWWINAMGQFVFLENYSLPAPAESHYTTTYTRGEGNAVSGTFHSHQTNRDDDRGKTYVLPTGTFTKR